MKTLVTWLKQFSNVRVHRRFWQPFSRRCLLGHRYWNADSSQVAYASFSSTWPDHALTPYSSTGLAAIFSTSFVSRPARLVPTQSPSSNFSFFLHFVPATSSPAPLPLPVSAPAPFLPPSSLPLSASPSFVLPQSVTMCLATVALLIWSKTDVNTVWVRLDGCT